MDQLLEALAGLKVASARRVHPPAGLMLRWAAVEAGFVTGLALFLDGEEGARPMRDYGAMKLFERWVPLSSAFSFLEATLAGTPDGAGFGQFSNGNPNRWLGRYDNLTEWPEWVLEARHEKAHDARAPKLPQGAVVSHGLPPFMNADRAADDWLLGHRSTRRDGPIRYPNQLLVVLPDTRGAIGEVRWAGDRVVGTVRSQGALPSLELQLAILTDEGRRVLTPIRPTAPEFSWETPAEARNAEVYLVHSSGELMGSQTLTPGATVADPAEARTPMAQAEHDIADGENERVEFKPYIERKHEKEQELIATVVAFANTAGGRLYIGVLNDGTPEGESALRRVMKTEPDETAQKYAKYVESVFTESIKPVPEFHTDIVHLAGHRVIMVTVEPGDDRPYSTRGHEVWIRKGASSMRPDPKTELPALYERSTPMAQVTGGLFANGLF